MRDRTYSAQRRCIGEAIAEHFLRAEHTVEERRTRGSAQEQQEELERRKMDKRIEVRAGGEEGLIRCESWRHWL
jgi:hypothetical protein